MNIDDRGLEERSEGEPTREELDRSTGPILLEFGASWCPHCQAAKPLIARALSGHPSVRHVRIEDGPGRKLGRTFRVKLWPTLIFMQNGAERSRLTRPQSAEPISSELAGLGPESTAKRV